MRYCAETLNGIGGSKPLILAWMDGFLEIIYGVDHTDYLHHQAIGREDTQQGKERDLRHAASPSFFVE
jgi:hypothetical protein